MDTSTGILTMEERLKKSALKVEELSKELGVENLVERLAQVVIQKEWVS